MRKLLAYFIQGALYTVPITATLFILYKFLKMIDEIIPIDIPGIGFLIVIATITLVGYLGSSIIIKPLFLTFDAALKKAPLIKDIYTSIKDFLSAFVGNNKKFNHPVIVTINKESGVRKVGFITNKDLCKLNIIDNRIAVYCPHSYAFSGEVFIVPSENVKEINAPAAQVMKFIISGGIAEMLEKHEQEETK